MCLSDLGRVVSFDVGRYQATVDVDGRLVDVSTVALGLDEPPPRMGDWLVIHTGLAVERLTGAQAAEVLGARDGLTRVRGAIRDDTIETT
jgi:hydrogenase maturation factor